MKKKINPKAIIMLVNEMRNGGIPKKMLGGITPLLSMIPGKDGSPNPLSSFMPMLDMVDIPNPKAIREVRAQSRNKNSNPFGNLKLGGELKKYDAPSHENGGQLLDAQLNPSDTGMNEIEKQETAYVPDAKVKEPYVFSDSIGLGDKTFADMSKDIDKRYKQDNSINRKAKTFEMELLQKKNDAIKARVEKAMKLRYGGEPKKLENGDNPFNPLNFVGEGFGIPDIPGIGIMGIAGDLVQNMQDNNNALEYDKSYTATGNIQEPKKPETKDKNLMGLSVALKGLGLVNKGAQVAEGALEQKEITPDFSKGDQIYEELGTDFTPLLNEIAQSQNIVRENIRGAAGNFSQYLSNLTAANIRGAKDAALTKLQGQQYNDQIGAQKAQREDSKASIITGEKQRVEEANLGNKAAHRDILNSLMTDISTAGSEVNKYQIYKDTIKNNRELANMKAKEFFAAMKVKYPNFGFDDKTLDILGDSTMSELDVETFNKLITPKYKG